MPVSKPRDPDSIELDRLRPYTFHGVDLTPRGSHAVGDCPFCGKEKFSVDIATGLWRCFVCGTGTKAGGGNALVFVRLLYDLASGGNVGDSKAGSAGFLDAVSADRRVSSAAVAAWGVTQAADGTWLLPGYGPDGKLDQVYRRTKIKDKDEWVWRLLPTPGIWPEGKVHALHLPKEDFNPARATIVVCEGPWDGMVLWETNRKVWGDANIIAVPGCNVWRDEWTAMCRGKQVILLYDSDHPIVRGGNTVRAGLDGMRRVAKRLSGVAASVRYLKWGPEGYDPDRPTGWDVRDQLTQSTDKQERRKALADLVLKIEPAPNDWFTALHTTNGNGKLIQPAHIESRHCETWAECEAAWKNAMYWRQDLGDATAVLLAICASTEQSGNQLFLDLIGSPGSAKSTLCQGLLVSNHCIHLENVTKLLSGFKKPGEADTDCSFLARSNGKTWITCEFDVLASSPHYRDLMGKVRRIFDGETSSTYGNDDKDRIYTALRTPWIRAGTQKMMDRMADYDQSQLGDRFLRFIISDPSDNDRRNIARSALRSERAALIDRVNSVAGSTVDPKTRLAYAVTGGYVDWLRAHADEQLAKVDVAEFVEDYCIDLAELSADMRARPSEDRRKLETHNTKELPTRLARQNIRLAMCLAVVMNKFTVDSEVLRVVRKVALDTAYGHSLNIAQWLSSPNPKASGRTYQESGGLMEATLATWTGMPQERLVNYLMFLRKIGVLELRKAPQSNGSWLLTDRVYNLYLRVMKG